MSSSPIEKYAIVLLIKQIFEQLDEIASLKKQGHKAGISQALLKEMCSILPELSDKQKEYYHDVLVKLSQHTNNARVVNFSPEYAEYSQSAKRRFLGKIKTDLRIVANS